MYNAIFPDSQPQCIDREYCGDAAEAAEDRERDMAGGFGERKNCGCSV